MLRKCETATQKCTECTDNSQLTQTNIVKTK